MMRPEDIDKLFRDRLGNASPTPPSDLWNRLQESIEQDKPQEIPVIIATKEDKKSYMWIYSSIAASMSLLLTVGVVFYNIKTTPEVSESIAKIEKPVIGELPATEKSETTHMIPIEPEFSEVQATESEIAASSIEKKDVTNSEINNVLKSPAKPKNANSEKGYALRNAKEHPATVSNKLTERSLEAAENVESPNTTSSLATTSKASSLNMNAEAVEIIIKRSITSQSNTQEATPEQSGFDKKATLAKNIFKQVRNLANGDEVELQALGIRADKVALETQIGNKKISKVINL